MLFYRSKRMFVQPYRVPWKAVVTVGVIAALAACAPRSETWSVAESPKRLQIDRAEFHHVIRFGAGADSLSSAEKSRLDLFLSRYAADRGIRARLAGGISVLDVRREAAVLAHIRRLGVTASMESGQADPAPDSGTVRLTLVRHVVTVPACGDWSKPSDHDYSNQPSSNFGCATTANLGLMVADPSVLVRGDEMGPGDGEALAKGVKAYREGEEKAAPQISPLVIQSAVSGGGGK